MQPSKSFQQQQANNAGLSSSQPSSDASDIFQELLQEEYPYGFLFPFDVPLLGTDFSAFDGTQSPGEISQSTQTETDCQEYEFAVQDQPAATTPEQSTPHDNQHRPLALVSNNNIPSEPTELLSDPGVWEGSLSSHDEAFQELILSAGPTDTDDPLPALAIEPSSVADETHHGHGDLPSLRTNPVDSQGMTNWRRQAQEPSFRVNVPSSSQSEEPTLRRRRRQSSSEQESRNPKRQHSSQAGSSSTAPFLGDSRFGQNHGGMNDNQPIRRNHLRIRTAPEATPVGDLLQVATQGQGSRTRNRRSSVGHACPYCPCSIGRLRDLPRHISAIHGNEKPKYSCEYCNKSYTRDDSRKRHYPNCSKKPKDT